MDYFSFQPQVMSPNYHHASPALGVTLSLAELITVSSLFFFLLPAYTERTAHPV